MYILYNLFIDLSNAMLINNTKGNGIDKKSAYKSIIDYFASRAQSLSAREAALSAGSPATRRADS